MAVPGAKKVKDDVAKTRVDPRWLRTREAILDAAQTLFAEHRHEVVGLDDLIRLASVSKQSFYNHFSDKDELVREILQMARQEFDALVTEANAEETDPARRIATALCIYAGQALDNPSHARLLARLALEDISAESQTNSPIVADVRLGLNQGRLAVFTLETGLAFIIGAGQALVNRVLLDGQRPLALSTAQQFVTLVLRAFGLSPIEAEVIASQSADRILRATE